MIKYAVWLPVNRIGKFEFLCSTQCHLTDSLEDAKEAAMDAVSEMQDSYAPRLSKKDALEELGGKPVIYKIVMTPM